MSIWIDIADAIVSELNNPAVGWSLAFTAKRYYLPVFKLTDLRELHVSVVPAGMDVEMLSRVSKQYDTRIDVAVQQKPEAEGDTEAARQADLLLKFDALAALTDEIEDHFTGKLLPGLEAQTCIGVENIPIYSPEHMERFEQFTSVLRFAFRGSQ